MNRNEWERRVKAGHNRLGGDSWNPDMVWRKVFADPTVVAGAYQHSGTGLWQDVTLYHGDGRRATRRLYF